MVDYKSKYNFIHMCIQVREGRYEKFKNGETDILICTDIASRGLDTIRVGITNI